MNDLRHCFFLSRRSQNIWTRKCSLGSMQGSIIVASRLGLTSISLLHLIHLWRWDIPETMPKPHTTYTRNNMGQKCESDCGLWVPNEKNLKRYENLKKKSWEPFGSYLLNSTANPAHFHPNLAGLAMLFRRQPLNGSQDFFVLIF